MVSSNKMDAIKFGSLGVKICWLIFIILNALTLIFMLAAVATPEWVSLDDTSSGYVFEGSINSVKDVSGLGLAAWEDETYADAASDWCDAADDAIPSNDTLDAGCAMFALLSICCCLYWTFELLAVVYTVVNIISMCVFFCHCDLIWLSCISITMANIWHTIAYILYAAGNRLTFEDDCDTFRDEDEPEPLCAEAGPALSLFIFLFMIIYGIAQCIVHCCYWGRKKKLGMSWRTARFQPQPYPGAPPAGVQMGVPQ